MSFDDMGLDPRLLRALAKRGFDKPTPVQVRGHQPWPGAWAVRNRR
jgi:superfamily II DNA/RNA helicase